MEEGAGDGDENGDGGDEEVELEDVTGGGGEGETEEKMRRVKGTNIARLRGVDVLLPLTSKKPVYASSKTGGRYGPAEKADIKKHFQWYFDNRKLPPIEVCRAYIDKYPNPRERVPRDIYYHVRDKVVALRKKHGM